MAVASLVVFLLIWEFVKLVVPADGVSIGGVRVLPRTTDGALPHVSSVISTFGDKEVDLPGSRTVGMGVAEAGWFSFKLALAGLVIGTIVGILLAVIMQRFRTAERALTPYVIASQTVPLVALAPLLNGWSGKIAILGHPWTSTTSVIAISAYLAFFPVTLGMLRGLHAPTTQSVELMHCYNAGWWSTLIRLRLPVAVGYLLPALRLAAAAAVVGAIVAEISTATTGGIGRLIIEYAQQSTGDASKLFCAVIGAAVVGLAMTAVVLIVGVGARRYSGNSR
ncbi:hypothetical protein GCM10027169_33970 [Gordonia jinhuaensis]